MVYTITQVQFSQDSKYEAKYCLWKEALLAVIFNLPFFTHGVETTYLTASAHSGHFISYESVPWTTTTMILSACVSGPTFCYVIDRFGRKTGIFSISMMQGISLVPHFLLNNKNVYTVQIFLHIIAGISSGGLFTVLPIYIREITVMRGFWVCSMGVLVTLGYVMRMVINKEVRLYLMVILVGIQFLSMTLMMESPSYLVMKKKYDAARRNLSSLKVLSEDDPYIANEISILKDESDRAKSNGELSIHTVYRTKIWWDALKIGFVLYTINVLCGSILFLDQQKTLIQLKLTADPDSTLVLSSLLGGGVTCLIFISFLDRKYLLTLGYVVIALSTGVLAVYTQNDLPVTSFRMVPITSLGVLVFGYGIAWALPAVLMVEIFNMEIRATFLGIIYAYSQIIKLIHVHTFKYLDEHIGVYTMFYIFAGINLYGVVYTLFAVPKTKSKNIRQIERQLKRPVLPA